MFADQPIKVGKLYVNGDAHRAREVLRVEKETVFFSDYDLVSGSLVGAPNKRCSRLEITRWAEREATPREVRSLKREEQAALFRVENEASAQKNDPLAGLKEAYRRSSFTK